MDEDPCLQYETIRFVFVPLAFFPLQMHRKTMSLTLAIATKSTSKAIVAQQKPLDFLAQVVWITELLSITGKTSHKFMP